MMPSLIAPSILGADLLRLSDELDALRYGNADLVNFDVMDGKFVPEISFGEVLLRKVRQKTAIPLDVHLMIERPEENLDSFIQAGADRITVHLEATGKLDQILTRLDYADTMAGLSICPETPVEAVYPYLERIGSVLLMTVHPGFGGQHFMESSIERIRTLRQAIEERRLPVRIAVDGGIRMDTAVRCREAGADTFVCGTFVFTDDRVEKLKQLRSVL